MSLALKVWATFQCGVVSIGFSMAVVHSLSTVRVPRRRGLCDRHASLLAKCRLVHILFSSSFTSFRHGKK